MGAQENDFSGNEKTPGKGVKEGKMAKLSPWYIIDEDRGIILAYVYGTRKEAEQRLDELKEDRQPGDKDYWNTYSIFGRAS